MYQVEKYYGSHSVLRAALAHSWCLGVWWLNQWTNACWKNEEFMLHPGELPKASYTDVAMKEKGQWLCWGLCFKRETVCMVTEEICETEHLQLGAGKSGFVLVLALLDAPNHVCGREWINQGETLFKEKEFKTIYPIW